MSDTKAAEDLAGDLVENELKILLRRPVTDKDRRNAAFEAVKELYEANLLQVDCMVKEGDELVVDWSKFSMDDEVKEAAAIIYLAFGGRDDEQY